MNILARPACRTRVTNAAFCVLRGGAPKLRVLHGVAPLIHYQLLPVCQDNGPLRHGHASMIVGNSQIVRNIEVMWVNHSQMGGLIWFYHVLPTLMRRYGEFLKVWSSPARRARKRQSRRWHRLVLPIGLVLVHQRQAVHRRVMLAQLD